MVNEDGQRYKISRLSGACVHSPTTYIAAAPNSTPAMRDQVIAADTEYRYAVIVQRPASSRREREIQRIAKARVAHDSNSSRIQLQRSNNNQLLPIRTPFLVC